MSNLKQILLSTQCLLLNQHFILLLKELKMALFLKSSSSQDKAVEVRYTKKSEFNEKIVKEYFEKKINLNSKKFDNTFLKEPFFLNN